MAKPGRNIWDEVERRVRNWLKELEDTFAPKTPQRAKVPVPVRVRDPRSRH